MTVWVGGGGGAWSVISVMICMDVSLSGSRTRLSLSWRPFNVPFISKGPQSQPESSYSLGLSDLFGFGSNNCKKSPRTLST